MTLKFPKLQFNRLQAGLAALLITTSYGMAVTTPALADPSAATQQFFGFSSSGGGGSALPASCDISKLKAEINSLNKQLSQVEDNFQAQTKTLEQEQSQLKPGDSGAGAKIQQEQTELLQSAAQQRAAIKAKEDVIHAATQGPSDQCKTDLVNQTVADIQRTVAAINGGQISATLAKVDSVNTEIENLVPSLGKAGVNSADINTVKKDLATVKAANATLRSFFAAMSSKGSAFIAAAEANPIGTYDSMQSGDGPLSGISGGASAAADNLVSSFTSLVNLFDKLTGTQEGQ